MILLPERAYQLLVPGAGCGRTRFDATFAPVCARPSRALGRGEVRFWGWRFGIVSGSCVLFLFASLLGVLSAEFFGDVVQAFDDVVHIFLRHAGIDRQGNTAVEIMFCDRE